MSDDMAHLITITDAGRAALVSTDHTGTRAREVVEIGLAAAPFEADRASKALPHEKKRIKTFGGVTVAPDTAHVTLKDDSAEQYSLYGFGLYLEDGTLFAHYGQTTPIMEKSPAAVLLLSADMQFASIDATKLVFGETTFLNPPASSERLGVVRIATHEQVEAGRDAERAVTPATLAKRLLGKANLSGAEFTGALGTMERVRLLAAPGIGASFEPGNGDGCSAAVNNVALRSSHGIGFGPNVANGPIAQGAFSHWFDTRTGDLGCRGALQVGRTISAQAPTPDDVSNTVPTTAWVVQAIANAAIGSISFEARASTRAGFLKLNGAVLKRADYPALWAYAQASGALVKDIEWWRNRKGCFSQGDETLSFRLPDLRGEFIRAFDDGASVDVDRVIGSWQNHQIQVHTHALRSSGNNYRAGSFVSEASSNTNDGGNSTLPTGGSETRPRNLALLALIRAY